MRRAGLAILAILSMAALGAHVWASDPSALWKIVHGACVANFESTGSPKPCVFVSVKKGYAVLKDLRGRYQFLLLPTRRISGIDSPSILARGAANYWRDAWKARRFIERLAGRRIPRADIALAVNSAFSRSQNQLHIHIDCVRRSVKNALRANRARIGPNWTRFEPSLAGHRWRAMAIARAELGSLNPFKILASQRPAARVHMASETLVLVGFRFADRRRGFVLLNDSVNLAKFDRASGESLLDHACHILEK